VEAFRKDDILREKLRDTLRSVNDVERLLARCSAGSGNARDLAQLRDTLTVVPTILDILQTGAPVLCEIAEDADRIDDLRQLLAEAIIDNPPLSVRDGGMVRKGYNKELDILRSASTEGKDWIAALENEEKERSGIKTLRVGYNNVFGYYIEISRNNLNNVPDDYIRKQTLEYEALVLGAEDKIKDLEYSILNQLREATAREADRIQKLARVIAKTDVLASFAETAARNRYVRPVVDDTEEIVITGGRHPVVEQTGSGERFISNDAYLNTDSQQLIILTGPNMAGKSTWLRQVALITLMAQIGSFVPADEVRIGVCDRIFTRVGASDDLATGQSTFMMEMTETANILNNATRKSLVILDEIGRGTSTFDGLSLAWAVAEHLHESPKLGCKTLFATHYHQLNELENTLKRIKNFRIAVKETNGTILFMRKIVPGGTDRSYGIHVARLAGLPPEVIQRAGQVLQSLEENDEITEKARGLADRHVTIPPPTPRTQLTLFEVKEHPIVDELMDIDVDDMTPRQALDAIARLQKKVGKNK
jgi:DNA mismatch repair protein MutS